MALSATSTNPFFAFRFFFMYACIVSIETELTAGIDFQTCHSAHVEDPLLQSQSGTVATT